MKKTKGRCRYFLTMATTKFYLDTRKVGKDSNKAVSLKIALNHRNSTAYITLPIQLTTKQWNAAEQKVINHPQKLKFNAMLRQRIAATEVILQEFALSGVLETLTPSELKKRVTAALQGTTVEALEAAKEAVKTPKKPAKVSNRENPHSFANWFIKVMNRHQTRTRDVYQSTFNRLLAWLGDDLYELTFEDIRKDWCQDFDEFLKPHAPSPNGRGLHFRNIRAVINDAIDNDITYRNGMRGFKIPKAPTRKRNLNVAQIRKVLLAQDLEPYMEKYRDFFALSFMLIGMNCKDICLLTEVENGRVEFNRSKTGKPFSIKVHEEAMYLIEKYHGKEGLLLNFAEGKKDYRVFYNRLALTLPKIKDLLNKRDDGVVIKELTSYWARHTWATIAASIDIPRDTIQAALGHNQHDVTSIYIEFDMRKVDEANRKVLDYVLYDKRS